MKDQIDRKRRAIFQLYNFLEVNFSCNGVANYLETLVITKGNII